MTNDGMILDNNLFQINQTYATTYTNRYPYTKGDSIGVILNYTGTTTGNNTTTNIIYTPIEDNISTSTGIDISSGTLTSGKIVISNNVDSSTGVSVVSMSGYTISSSNPIIDISPILLMHFDGNINNSGTNSGTINNNGVTFSAGKFGQSSYFNGSSYLSSLNSNDWIFGLNDFTIDFWIKTVDASSTIQRTIVGYRLTADYGSGWSIWQDGSNGPPGSLTFYLGSTQYTWSNILQDGVWVHIAVVSIGGLRVTLYKNGVAQSTQNLGVASGSSNYILSIGSRANTDYFFSGYIDELRISKGIARWTSDFSGNLPSSPY